MKQHNQANLILIALILPYHTSSAFVGLCPHKRVSKHVCFYRNNDNRAEIPNNAQQQNKSPMILRQQPSSLSWNAHTEELWTQAWCDAFVRAGLIDFTPPLTDRLFCLMLGDLAPETQSMTHLPFWPQRDGYMYDAQSCSETVHNCLREVTPEADALSNMDHVCSDLLHLPDAQYDCLFDVSLLNEVVCKELSREHLLEDQGLLHHSCNKPSTTARETLTNVGVLLLRATKLLKEHGIYVVITQEPLKSSSVLVRDFLLEVGGSLGLQWKLDLEEISGSNCYVSVARRYHVGKLPSFRDRNVVTKRKRNNRDHNDGRALDFQNILDRLQ